MKLSTKPGLTSVAIIAIVAGVLLAGGAVTYVATDGFSSDDAETSEVAEQSNNNEQTSNETEAANDVSLLRQALSGGDEIRCEYSDENGQGVAYITDEQQMRVDFTSAESGESIFIKNDQNIYIWTEGEAEGIMFNTDVYDQQYEEQYDVFDPAEFEEETPENVDINCERDNFDDDLLQAPSDIEFTDFGQFQQSIPQPQ
jgi:hypothetical protein